MSRIKLYLLLGIGCMVGYVWLFSNYTSAYVKDDVDVCLIKKVTHIPCPSCGSTRSVLSLMHGNVAEALAWNPVGLILFLILLIAPVWIAYDLLSHKSTLHKFYLQTEIMLRRKWIAIPAIALVLANWAWNIHKGL